MMKIGAQGASSSGVTPGPVMKPRTVARSRRPWAARAGSARKAALRAPENTVGPSRSSSQLPTRTSIWERIASIRASTASASTVTRVSISSVSPLQLVRTRSKTCIM